MSWQAMEAIRDHSESRGAARTIGFVLASYADKYGNGIFVSLDRLCEEAKVARKTAVDGRAWFIERGEAELVDRPDGRPLLRGRTRVMSLAPLLRAAQDAEAAESSESEPLAKGSESEPQSVDGSLAELSRVQSAPLKVQSTPLSSSAVEPDTEGNEKEPEADTETGAREARASGLSPLSASPAQPPDARLLAERREDEAELAQLESQLPRSGNPAATQRAINDLRSRLGRSASLVGCES